MTTSSHPVLAAEHISRSFGAVAALRDASVNIEEGQILGLVGDNGAGKSTLIKILAGVVTPDSGRITLDGADLTHKGPQDALNSGIETVYQDLALVDTMTAYQNVYMGREVLAKSPVLRLFNKVDDRAMRRGARDVLDDLGVKIPSVNANVKQMSGGQRQCLAIARAVLWGRRIVILDEPTAALGVHESEQVLELVSRLRERKISVILVTHNMQHLMQVADRVTVMRLGRTIANRSVKSTTGEEIVGLITGALPPDEEMAGPANGGNSAETAAESPPPVSRLSALGQRSSIERTTMRYKSWPKYRVLGAAASLIAIVFAAGCGSSSGGSSSASSSSGSSGSGSSGNAVAAKNFKVCMGTGGQQGLDWTIGQGTVLQSIAKKEGWQSVILSNNNSASTAVSNVGVFIQDKCNVVVEFNGQPSSNPVMALKLSAAKIPTITYDIAQKGWYFVGIDNLKAGIEGGEAFGQWMKQNWNCDPDAIVASQGYNVGVVNTQRTGGMVTGVLKACPNIGKSKVFSINGEGQVSTTLPLARALLAAHGSWKKIAVVGLNDSGVVGVLQAAQQLGRFTDTYGWGQDGSLITGTNVNPHLLGSVEYFLEGYPENALPIIKSIEAGHPMTVKDNTSGNNSTVVVTPCPVTAAQAKKLPTFDGLVAKMEASAPGTTEYSLFCPSK
jgi:ABC-type branched-subunit amino acid transport system ATPase component/ABC-type sugar transport system substrate-binding protein